MRFTRINIEEFKKHAPTNRKTDFFTSKFIAHCKTGGDKYNDNIIGCYNDQSELMGAAVITVSKNRPHIANLQLLQTFSTHSGKGVATKLFDHALADAWERGGKYIRASFEPTAVGYYVSHGWEVHGMQKSGYFMSMAKLNGSLFSDASFSREDDVVRAKAESKVMGGCHILFDEPSTDLEFILSHKKGDK